MSLLDEIAAKLQVAAPEARKALVEQAVAVTRDMAWCPNPGPQTNAVLCEADELFYGGQAGGGKTDLELGLSLTRHRRSLILRRTNKEALGLVERMTEILGSRDGWASQDGTWRRPDGRTIDIGGCQLEEDKQKYKGKAHDLCAFDEITDFTETQYVFIIGWNRSTVPGQRCRIVCTGNPPTSPEGLWVVKRWAAWLDPNHQNPAQPGELRWYTTGDEGREIEVDGPGPYMINGKSVRALSRTFIPAELDDNPDLSETNYRAHLDAMPEELRRAYRDGRFDAVLKDEPFQVFPTAWVAAAQKRWTPGGSAGLMMTALSHDPAGGGGDPAAIAMRYGGWYAPIETVKGAITADGSEMAAWVVRFRRHGAPVVVDMGGGYGGAVMLRLKDNNIDPLAFNGAAQSTACTRDGKLRFVNKRAEIHWKLREELDPDQEGGSVIALPDDPEIRADLCALRWKLTTRGIQIESKDEVRERIGRSPTKGDVIAMALSEGNRAAAKSRMISQARGPEHGGRSGRSGLPQVVMHKR